MELRQLRYFLALADELNFHRAAKQLHMTQPPLSRAIQALERELGTPLFHRHARGLTLTHAGETLRTDATRLMSSWSRTMDRVRGVREGAVAPLRIGFEGSVGRDVPALIDELTLGGASSPVALIETPTRDQRMRLHNRDLDVSIAVGHADFDGLRTRALGERTLAVGVALTHRLAKKKSIKLADLERENFVFSNDAARCVTDEIVQALCIARGFHARSTIAVSDSAMAFALVARGYGVRISLGEPCTANGRCRSVPIADVPGVALRLVARADDDNALVARLFESTAAR